MLRERSFRLMSKHETKLKMGRKLDDVDAGTASDNQVSVLFRYDEAGADAHISLSIESDKMSPDDVKAILELPDARGLFTKTNSRSWVSQPAASEAKFGKANDWKGVDIKNLAHRLSTHIPQP